MSDKSDTSCSGGFGCISLLVFLLFVWAWWFGLPTFWGELQLDLFWPAVRLDGITYLGN